MEYAKARTSYGVLSSGDANMWYERHPYKMEIVGSTPTTTTITVIRSYVQALHDPLNNDI